MLLLAFLLVTARDLSAVTVREDLPDLKTLEPQSSDQLSRDKKLTPTVLLGVAILGGSLVVSVTFVITLTKMVRRKTAYLESYSREIGKNEERFRLAMDASRDGLWDWNVLTGELYFSPGYYRMLEYQPHELKAEFSTWSDHIHPDDYNTALKANTDCIEGVIDSFTSEMRMLTRDGNWRWILTRGAAVERRIDGRALRMIGTHTDITSLVETRNALKKSEERLKIAASAAHLGVWDWNLQNGLLDWDAKMFAMYGIDPGRSESMATAWEKSIHPDDRGDVIAKLNNALKNDSSLEIEFRILTGKGVVRTIKTFATILREDGTAVRMTGVDLDVTEKRTLEQQIRHTQKMDAIGRLAGGIAHDFNNKLTVILGYAQLIEMLDCVTPERCGTHLEEIIKAAHHSQEITRKLLAFARDESPESCLVDINHTLKDMEKSLGRLIGEHIRISYSRAEDLWPVFMNPTEYDQIIMNLVVNARDAMPDGGKLAISTANATVSENIAASYLNAAPGEYVVTAISDTGCGISREIIDRIFDPFFTTKETGKGTGLGLSTVYGIVNSYHGFISVESEPAKGTTFSIYLPRHHSKQSTELLPGKIENSGSGSGVILLVEDEESVREMTRLFLETSGFTVLAAESPEKAVELCQKDQTIDCVLSDVIMPGLNGKQLADKIHTIRAKLPFVFMSGYTSDIITSQGIAAEGMHFVRKPLNLNRLTEQLLSVIRHSKSETDNSVSPLIIPATPE